MGITFQLDMFFDNDSLSHLNDALQSEGVNLLMVAEESQLDIQALIDSASARGKHIAGGIFPMVIADNTHHKEGVILKYIPSSARPTLVHPVSEVVGDFQLPELTPETKSCIIFLDGLMQGIPRFLERIYEQYWNSVSYLGAGAGSLTLEQRPCVFNNEGIFKDAALIIPSEGDTQLGVNHGWAKAAGPFVANKVDGNRILELNWRPAFELYREVVEQHSELSFDSAEFFDISKGFPFGIHREDAEEIVRDPIAVGEGGSLVCVGEVNANTSLNILRGNADSLLEGARSAARESVSQGQGNDLLVVDCISRVLYLEDSFEKELQTVHKEVVDAGVGLSVEGVLSIGEISSGKGGFLELYNKTIVVCSFR